MTVAILFLVGLWLVAFADDAIATLRVRLARERAARRGPR